LSSSEFSLPADWRAPGAAAPAAAAAAVAAAAADKVPPASALVPPAGFTPPVYASKNKPLLFFWNQVRAFSC
jgi:hypothetical protein